MCARYGPAAVIAAALISSTVAVAVPRTLTFEDRLEAQRAIEQVYWSHRVWPADNPGTKPPLAEVMPDAVLRSKVQDTLKRSQALEQFWSHALTQEELQAELDRMVARSRQPEILQEIFAALDNDPFVIAECLARPALAERLLRTWYAYDRRIHVGTYQRAQRAASSHPGVSDLRRLGGTYEETEWTRSSRHDDAEASISEEKWPGFIRRLGIRLGSTPAEREDPGDVARLPIGRVGPLVEDESAWSVTAVLSAGEGRVRLATVSWAKKPLESWLEGVRVEQAPLARDAAYRLAIPSAGCSGDTWTTPSIESPNDWTDYAVAAWTGTEMIIVGHHLQFGLRYAPSTDTWTAISAVNAPPSTLTSYTSVWTGSEMIVWGGRDFVTSTQSNAGFRYNSATNTWASTSLTNAPTPRYNHVAVWTGLRLVVWGGTGDSSGGRYDPASDSWTPTSLVSAPSPRIAATAVWAPGPKVVVVWGGENGGVPVNSGGRYSPVTDTWSATSTTNAPTGRGGGTSVWTGSDVLVWGGCFFVPHSGWACPPAGGRYNPVADSWTAMSATGQPFPQNRGAAFWTGSQMLVWGGIVQAPSNTGGLYTPSTDSWQLTSSVNVPAQRIDNAAVWTGTELIVWGGRAEAQPSGGRYNPVTSVWTPTSVGDTPNARETHTTVWTGTEMIVWGGFNSDAQPRYFNTGGRYDPATDNWVPTSTTAAPLPRQLHTAVWSGTEMIVWGGTQGGAGYLASGGRYNPASNTWTATTTSGGPVARSGHTAVWTGTEMIVWGGSTSTLLDSGGRYAPATDTWTATRVSGGPTARYGHSAVWTGSEMLIWGGTSGPTLGDGSRYSPATDTWAAMSAAGAPAARQFHGAAWSGTTMFIWGGSGGSSGAGYFPSSDSWAPMAAAGAPTTAGNPIAFWTGDDLLVWVPGTPEGGRYLPSGDSWTPLSTTNAPPPLPETEGVWTGSKLITWGGGSYYTPSSAGGIYCACPGAADVFRDADGDGFGNTALPLSTCSGVAPPGYAAVGGDCNDADSSVRPGGTQICDGQNNNCSDPNWPAVPANEANADGDGFRICAGDCADNDSAVYPGAPQICDNKNNNCSDPTWPALPANEADADGDGFRVCQNDCNDANPNVRPNATETCNGIDDNCVGGVDEDGLGVDTDGDGVHNACDNCNTVSNPAQTDSDADQVGNACDNCVTVANSNQTDTDADTLGNACDNCPLAPNLSQIDGDGDRAGDACDDCLFEFNPTQSDSNHDGEGDVCDLNDGLIYVLGTDDDNYIEWQQEAGPQSWNVYEGDLAVLKSSGTYTQAPGSNSQADRHCGVTDVFQNDVDIPPLGRVTFHLVTGVTGGVEGSLGTNSAGTPRPNANPCP